MELLRCCRSRDIRMMLGVSRSLSFIFVYAEVTAIEGLF